MPQGQPGKVVLIHPHQRKKHHVPNNLMTYEVLSPEEAESFAMYTVTASPGQSTGPALLQHAGDETLLVLSGVFELEVEGLKYPLRTGDSVYVPRGQHHRLTNVGTEPGTGVFVISPPKYF